MCRVAGAGSSPYGHDHQPKPRAVESALPAVSADDHLLGALGVLVLRVDDADSLSGSFTQRGRTSSRLTRRPVRRKFRAILPCYRPILYAQRDGVLRGVWGICF